MILMPTQPASRPTVARSTTASGRATAAAAHPAQLDLSRADLRVHLIGIGGCGVSGLARLLASRGCLCSGSDSVATDITAELEADGISVSFDQMRGEIPRVCDLVIASAAIRPDNPEILAAQQRDIPVISYAEALGRVQAAHTGVSIAGTHGKSTTSAMLCHVLIECGLDPSFIVGATCPQIGGGSRTGAASIPLGPRGGARGILVAEACEFNRSFHHHRPQLALINNVEEDHLDIYGTLDAVVTAFGEFARLVPPADEGGRLLIAHDGAHRREITAGLRCAVETFGFNPAADWQVVADPTARRVGLMRQGSFLAQWSVQMPGEHNALNSSAAAILAHWLGAEWDDIAQALSNFHGVERRMQRLGVRRLQSGGNVVVYDDYGHHPTEIDSTLRALRIAEKPQRLICVFQPHQHSRTRFLLDQFAQSFTSADVVIVPHIYFVRDSEIEKSRISAADLVDRLRARGVVAMHLYPFEAIVEQLEVICRPGDLVVIMGAGPVWQVARGFLNRQDARAGAPKPSSTTG
jgi:UDP-N-acetylmuramate--alanine ligase